MDTQGESASQPASKAANHHTTQVPPYVRLSSRHVPLPPLYLEAGKERDLASLPDNSLSPLPERDWSTGGRIGYETRRGNGVRGGEEEKRKGSEGVFVGRDGVVVYLGLCPVG